MYNLYFYIYLKILIFFLKFVKEWLCLFIILIIILCVFLNNKMFLYIMFFVDKGFLERKKSLFWIFFDRFMKVNIMILYFYILE